MWINLEAGQRWVSLVESETFRDWTDAGGFVKLKVFEYLKFVSMLLGVETIDEQIWKT